MTTIIDGKKVAQSLRDQLAIDVAQFKNEHGFAPGLAVVLVGMNPASQVYVKNKCVQTKEVGMESFSFELPESTSQAELLKLVETLNNDPKIHGILVQLPLPKHIEEAAVIEAIHPDKDVDGFHVVNSGKLMTGQKGLVPCTPKGSMILLRQIHPSLDGLHAVVIGRSNIVGKPIAQLLLQAHCTVTITHSKTKNLEEIVRQGDIVVAALGKPHFVKASWVKPGATVIDVGINRITTSDGKTKLVGDVDYDEVAAIAGAITPVPGGVGPMTIACLLQNTLEAAKHLLCA
ncbi:MAG: bifunctional methylenetetrahydrofolate dehydrogenase/methenyltetrahydrofolate cyclohydrolase FolD [Alphaproteobacteria bacterium]|nr:bifunctional methylenetetrahydrofolate dehydrogenase/methenyltetrahydrofolate cyclohydrolase FolD [Alphaproteobacteria bacterium]